jgi:hypothetical protein
MTNNSTEGRNFTTERLVARITELRQQYDDGELDYKNFKLETAKVFVALDDTPGGDIVSKQLLEALKALAKFS